MADAWARDLEGFSSSTELYMEDSSLDWAMLSAGAQGQTSHPNHIHTGPLAGPVHSSEPSPPSLHSTSPQHATSTEVLGSSPDLPDNGPSSEEDEHLFGEEDVEASHPVPSASAPASPSPDLPNNGPASGDDDRPLEEDEDLFGEEDGEPSTPLPSAPAPPSAPVLPPAPAAKQHQLALPRMVPGLALPPRVPTAQSPPETVQKPESEVVTPSPAATASSSSAPAEATTPSPGPAQTPSRQRKRKAESSPPTTPEDDAAGPSTEPAAPRRRAKKARKEPSPKPARAEKPAHTEEEIAASVAAMQEVLAKRQPEDEFLAEQAAHLETNVQREQRRRKEQSEKVRKWREAQKKK